MSNNDSNDSNIKTDHIGFLTKMADATGVSCATVKDGHVLIFKKSYLENILAQYKDRDRFVIFVKRPDFND